MKKLFSTLFANTILTALLFTFTLPAVAIEKVTIFAAASLTNAMEDIKAAYSVNHNDVDIVYSFASSSVLAKQIEQGAPANIFISADQKWMHYLTDRDLATGKLDLLKNELVLIAPVQSLLNKVEINKSTNWRKILPADEKIALGDPAHVPAGLYAKESLTHLGVFDQLSPQFAPASNVRDALMLVERNEALLGIVYSTDAKVSKKVKIVGTFPADTFEPIVYPIALVTKTPATEAFYQYLYSNEALAIFAKYGFITN
ncbi:molybdate ABC transporter substrate-binding protein [Orbaceae bacterium ESL0721]|nr:molybdate ABC transporter substrate-binding protein [Orbaceae bacterium ESL0721]